MGPPAREQNLAANPPYALHSRPAQLNPGALPGPATTPGWRTRLNLFPNIAPDVEWQTLDRHATSNYAWQGRLPDDPLSATTLTVVGGVTILEVISPKHGHFAVHSRDDGTGEVRQFDPEKLKGNGNCFVQEAGAGARALAELEGAAIQPAAEGVTIDVLMIYTTRAMNLAGGRSDIVAKAQAAVNGENSNFNRSGVLHRMRLVHTREVGHTASGNLSTELGWVAGNSTVASIRNEVGADLVAFLSDRDDYNTLGIAYQLTSTSGNSGQAFSANYYDTVSGVWPHEAGHNLGCQHNSAGVYSYSSGHYWDDSGTTRGSIMSYIGT
ncbi:MAG: zinc-dependent metalloprotease family protein, partial [Desulfobacterales bacterium]|nr:zinc-dependent metalloprotease family protein [Desulfobacterales bacterium]